MQDQIAYVAALSNNSLEVVDLKMGKVIGSINGLDEPQGVSYITKHQELLIANGGSGECGFYNDLTLKKTASIKLSGDADDVRYDAVEDKIYVGYGSGGIAIIDASSQKLVGNITLPAHPEAFQINTKASTLYVNLPGSGSIGIADLKHTKLVSKWSKLLPRGNFPMAYDYIQHRILVGYRFPAKLLVFDSESGKELYRTSIVGDVDDLYWDTKSKRIYVSGGGGMVNIFKQTGYATYSQIANIKSRQGARTSLFVPELNIFLLAARKSGNQGATLLVYKPSLN